MWSYSGGMLKLLWFIRHYFCVVEMVVFDVGSVSRFVSMLVSYSVSSVSSTFSCDLSLRNYVLSSRRFSILCRRVLVICSWGCFVCRQRLHCQTVVMEKALMKRFFDLHKFPARVVTFLCFFLILFSVHVYAKERGHVLAEERGLQSAEKNIIQITNNLSQHFTPPPGARLGVHL